jgi:haloalkane dehalogenase
LPVIIDNPGREANPAAREMLEEFSRPFQACFSTRSWSQRGLNGFFMHIPGCAVQSHVIIESGGHFLQEDAGGFVDWIY